MADLAASRPHTKIALVAGASYVLLCVLVAVHVTDPLDVAAHQWFRPDDVWGPTQWRADAVVEGLAPKRIGLLLPLAGAVGVVLRRSWAPGRIVLEIGVSTLAIVLITKALLGRTDPHGEAAQLSGSFPSGHTVVLLTVLGGCLLALTTSASWWLWAGVFLVDGVMGWCLLLEGAHWFTDVLGGLLAGVVVLAAVDGSRTRRSVRVKDTVLRDSR